MPLTISRRTALASLGASLILPRTALAQSVRAPDREQMVTVEGGRIYARMNGEISAERPPLLMVHGGPGANHSSFLPALPLAHDRAIILYDQLDSGRSDTPNDPANWRVTRFVDEVDAVRRAFALDRFHLYGVSWGGTIALEYAARRPSRLVSTTLQSPLISTRSWLADADVLRRTLPPSTQTVLDRCETTAPPPRPQCDAATDIFYKQFLQREAVAPEFQAYRDALPVPFNARIYEAMWGRSEFVSTGTLRNYDGEHLLGRLEGSRTLFVTGQYDEARPETLARFAKRVSGAEFAVIPGAAHRLLYDRTEAFLPMLKDWLERNDPV